MRAQSLMLLSMCLIAATVSFPAAGWLPTKGAESQEGNNEQMPQSDRLPRSPGEEIETAVRARRDVSAAFDTIRNGDVATMTTMFNNTHLHQPHINLTINNMFGKSGPNTAALNAVIKSVNMFDNIHIHQPQMNVTINNCF